MPNPSPPRYPTSPKFLRDISPDSRPTTSRVWSADYDAMTPCRHVCRCRCGRSQRKQAQGAAQGGPVPVQVQERQPAAGASHATRTAGLASKLAPPDAATIRRVLGTLSPLRPLTIGSPTTHRRQQARAPPPRTLTLAPRRMAPPPPPPSEQPATAAAGAAEAGLISKVLIVMAMEAEAMPLVHNFKLVEAPADESTFHKGAPWLRYHGNYKGLHIDLVRPGKDTVYGVDSVGTLPAALLTYSSVQTLKPDLIVNAGTAGGFNAKGAKVGDVYLASDVAFHDRRIPIPVFDMYGVGARKTFGTPNILKELNLKAGKLSTGNSLDMSPKDEEMIRSNDATIKDMEGAAVAYIADMFSSPTIFVKAVTDIVDGEKPTAEEFLMNLITVTATLELAVVKVIDFISGKCLSDL